MNKTISTGIPLGTIETSVSPLEITATATVKVGSGHTMIGPVGYPSAMGDQVTDQVGGVALLAGGYGGYAAGLIQGQNAVHPGGGVGALSNSGTIGATTSYLSPAGTINNSADLTEEHQGIYVDAADSGTGANFGAIEGSQSFDRAVTSLAGGSLAATATFSDLETSPGIFSYTVTLNNTGTTTIGTFWFAWDDVPPKTSCRWSRAISEIQRGGPTW